MRGAPAEVAAWVRGRTPAEAAAREREGRGTLKREGEEDENFLRDGPMRGEGKNCLGKRHEKVCIAAGGGTMG
jgi:hypothetical protein